MDIGLMVEGQEGVTWQLWRRGLATVERLGFASLFRSDHYFVHEQTDSLEAFLSFVLAATETTRARFGTLVSPVMFRSPVDVGRMAAQLDVLSSGRFVLGLGIGWYEPEHRAYGISFPPIAERFDRLEEAIELYRRLWGPSPATFVGRHYSIVDVDCRPKPMAGRIPILIGGGGEKRTLAIVAGLADEWCSECISVEDYRRKVEVLERHCERVSRDPASIRRSMVIAGSVVPTARRVLKGAMKHAIDTVGLRSFPPEPFTIPTRLGGFVVGGREQLVDTLGRYAALGLQEAVFKHYDLASDVLPDYLASMIMPAVRRL